ncbi:rhsC in rhs element domain protein [Escherichia coli DEC7B]|nr:rhsC in rhs element domain protein [Escherichia coli DEC7B]
MRPDGGADAKPDGPGVHAGAKIHLYHCDHRGLPLALVSTKGQQNGAQNTMNGATC